MPQRIRTTFNEDRKQKYMEEYGRFTKTLNGYFLRLSHEEKRLDKDLAEMDREELMNAITSMKIRSVDARGHAISMVRSYIEWAVINGYPGSAEAARSISALETSVHDNIVREMLSGPEQLEELIDDVLDFNQYEFKSTRAALILWLLFFGVEPHDVCNLKKTDIDYDKKIVLGAYEVDDNVVALWRKWSTAEYVEMQNEHAEFNTQLLKSDSLFPALMTKDGKSTRSGKEILTYNGLIKIVKDIFDKHEPSCEEGISVSPKRIVLSGEYYRVLMLEQAGVKVTGDIIKENVNFPDEGSYGTRENRIRKFWLDYGEWKAAFGYRA